MVRDAESLVLACWPVTEADVDRPAPPTLRGSNYLSCLVRHGEVQRHEDTAIARDRGDLDSVVPRCTSMVSEYLLRDDNT